MRSLLLSSRVYSQSMTPYLQHHQDGMDRSWKAVRSLIRRGMNTLMKDLHPLKAHGFDGIWPEIFIVLRSTDKTLETLLKYSLEERLVPREERTLSSLTLRKAMEETR